MDSIFARANGRPSNASNSMDSIFSRAEIRDFEEPRTFIVPASKYGYGFALSFAQLSG